MVTALANGSRSPPAYTLAIAIQNAGMEDLRIIADEFRDGVEGYYSQEYGSRPTARSKRSTILRARWLQRRGSAVDVAMRAMLRKYGLEDKRDYTIVESAFPHMRAMLGEEGGHDPAVIPFSYDPELRKIAVRCSSSATPSA